MALTVKNEKLNMSHMADIYDEEYANGNYLAEEHRQIFERIKAGDEPYLHQLIHKEVCEQNGTDWMVLDEDVLTFTEEK